MTEAPEVEEHVCYEREGQLAFVTLNRPSVLNALTVRMRQRLGELVLVAASDPEVRAIVFRGAGDRAFSVGADIKEFSPAESLSEIRDDTRSSNEAITSVSKPTIAAVHGYCLGGGLELALACDLRLASEDAVFGLPEVQRGTIPGAGGTQLLPSIVGMGNALRLILSGEMIDATEALRIGLISAVVPRQALSDTTMQWASKIVEAAPIALAYAKEAVRRGSHMSLADGLRLEADLTTLLTNTEDRLEGAKAFRERRPPVYRGR